MLGWESEQKQHHNLDELILDDTYKNHWIFLSIVIPVYNEERTVKSVLETLPRNRATEIIVVDDHSTDNSLEEVKKVQHHENIRIIQHKQNMGYGKALLTGINNSKGKIIITMDSDGQHQALDLYNLIKPILKGEADITVGSRYVGSYNYRLSVFTRVGEAAIEKFILMFFRQKVMNNQGGFRAFHRKTLKIFKEIKFEDYAFTTELLLKAALSKYRIKESPIHLLDREHGRSKIILTKLLLNLLLCVGYYTIQWVNRPYVNKWMIKRMQFFHNLPIYGRYKSIDKIYPTPERVFVAA